MHIVPQLARVGRTIVVLGLIGALGCAEDPLTGPSGHDPDEPGPGPAPGVAAATLDVEIRVDGALPDPDGYAVILTIRNEGDRPAQQVASSGGMIRFPDLPAGTHEVRLESVADNCRVANGTVRGVTLEAGRTRTLGFDVYCRAPGRLVVRTVTVGRDADPDGYAVVFEGTSAQERPIGTNDTLEIGELDLPPGEEWTARLTGIADNCLPRLPNLVSIRPFTRDTPSHVVFSIVCLTRGSKIAFERDGEIFLAPIGGAVTNLTDHPAADWGPSLSPDGRRVLFSSNRDGDGDGLYVLDVETRSVHRLSTGAGFHHSGSQAWSPDGSRIVFSSTRADSTFDVFTLFVDTGEIVRLTSDLQASDFSPSWSPDGSSIAFCRSRISSDGAFQVHLYRMSATDGSGLVELAEDGCNPTWSPDGLRIAFTKNVIDEFAPNEVAVVDATGGPVAVLTSGWSPTWAPDGESIAYNTIGGNLVIAGITGRVLSGFITLLEGFSPSWR